MPKLPSDYQLHSTKSDHKPSLKKITLPDYLSKKILPVIENIAIFHEKGRVRVFILDSYAKHGNRLIDEDLESLCITFLATQSYIKGTLTLSVANRGLKMTISCTLKNASKPMIATSIIYPKSLSKSFKIRQKNQDLESSPY